MTTARSWSGPEALADARSAGLDDLLRASGAPVGARLPWLTAIADCDDVEPWVVGLEDGEGRLVAAAVLGRRQVRGGWRVTGLGHGTSDRTWLAVREADLAPRLAAAIDDGLEGLDGEWVLLLEQLPGDDPVGEVMLASLRNAQRHDGDGCPLLRFDGDRDPASHLSKSTRGNFRNARNRMERDGHEPSFGHLRDPDEIVGLLPRLEEIHRQQDAFLNRRTRFEDPVWACTWRRIVEDHAGRGELELNVLRVGDRVDAYSICFLDGPVYRYWNIAYDPDLREYSPGSTLWVATVQHVLEATDCDVFDFMRGEESYKLRLTDVVEPAWELAASSSRARLAAARAPGRARELVNEARERSETVDRAVDRLKKVLRGTDGA